MNMEATPIIREPMLKRGLKTKIPAIRMTKKSRAIIAKKRNTPRESVQSSNQVSALSQK